MKTERHAARWAALVALAACSGGPPEDAPRPRTAIPGLQGPTSAPPCPAPPPDLPAPTGLEDQAAQRPTPLPFVAIAPDELPARLWSEPRLLAYVPPTPRRAAAMGALVRCMLADPPPRPADLVDLAHEAGYEIQAWDVAGERLIAAIEPLGLQTGGGAYLVRADPTPGPPVLLQAPHAFYDLGTERIALDLLLAGRTWPRALFVNTVHRYLDVDGARRQQRGAPADPCHNPSHLFAVATAAALDAQPEAEILQIHGFGDDAPHEPDVVVSAGDRAAPTPRSAEVAARLRAALDVDVALFPVDDTRLAATANVQGRLVRARGRGASFVHVELSQPLRRRLRRDPDAQARLAAALRPGPAPQDLSQRALD